MDFRKNGGKIRETMCHPGNTQCYPGSSLFPQSATTAVIPCLTRDPVFCLYYPTLYVGRLGQIWHLKDWIPARHPTPWVPGVRDDTVSYYRGLSSKPVRVIPGMTRDPVFCLHYPTLSMLGDWVRFGILKTGFRLAIPLRGTLASGMTPCLTIGAFPPNPSVSSRA